MSEWKKVKLKNICSDIIDCVNKTAPVCDYETPYKMLRTSDIRNGQINTEGLKCVSKETFEKWNRRGYLQKGDVIFTREAPVGEVGWLKDPKNLFLGQRLMFFRADNKKCDNRFLFYSLFFSDNKRNIIAKSNGSTVNHLRVPDCENIEIYIPDLHTQQNIAIILSRYDSLIENYQKQIKLLEEAAQRLYKEWFVDLHFPGHENTKIVDGVPEGWEKKTLSDISSIIMGQSPKSEFYNTDWNGLPFHQGVGSYGYRFVVDNIYSTSFTRIAEPNSILFSVRAPVGRLNITKNKIVIGRGLAAINHKKGCQSYLYYLLKEKFFKDNIIGNGAIFASISKDELYNQVFVIPSDEMVKRYDAIANKIDKNIQSVDSQIRLLTEARDRLLPKLMSGEIAV